MSDSNLIAKQMNAYFFSSSNQENKLYSNYFERLGLSPKQVQSGGYLHAIKWLKQNNLPDVLIIDLDTTESPLIQVEELKHLCGPTCHVIAIGSQDNLTLYRSLTQMGAFDYLVKPVSLDQLSATLDATRLGQRNTTTSGRTIAVTGAGGGSGVTLVATSIASLLASERRVKTALIDYDMTNGNAGLLLGHHEDAGLSAALTSDTVDTHFLNRAMIEVEDRLYLLAQNADYNAATLAPEEHEVLALGSSLCQLFNQSVWDLPSSQPQGSLSVLKHAHTRIIVTDLTAKCARNVLRLLNTIGSEEDGQQIFIVQNDIRHKGKTGVSKKEFESFIGRSIDLSLPNIGSKLERELMYGKFSLNAFPELQKALLNLADLASGKHPQISTGMRFGWLKRSIKKNNTPVLSLEKS